MDTQALIPCVSRKERISRLMANMNSGLLERTEQVKLLLLAALAGEHVLFLGPPGTAKSELAKRLRGIFVEANYFERLLTRFSVPEELFGPLSIQALEEDKYKRLTSGYLPEASVAFIDEIFKANSAILNSLLTLLNERQFDNGNRRYSVPLVSVVAASNELPEGEELNALYDRFMLRSFVKPVSDDAFQQLLTLDGIDSEPELSDQLRVEELDEVRSQAEKVTLSPAVIELCKEFRRYLHTENIHVSDRRWRKLIKLMKVSAFTSGYHEVSNYDAWILPHCLWQKPEQFEGLLEVYKKTIAIESEFSTDRISTMLAAWEGKLCEDRNNSSNKRKRDEKGRPLFISVEGKETTRPHSKVQKKNSNGQLLYEDRFGSETTEKSSRNGENDPLMWDQLNQEAMESARYSSSHIEGRLAGVQSLREKIEGHIRVLATQLASADSIFSQHLWLDQKLLPEVTSSLQNAKEHTEKLLVRAEKLAEGFASLPREDDVLANLGVDSPLSEGEVIAGELCD